MRKFSRRAGARGLAALLALLLVFSAVPVSVVQAEQESGAEVTTPDKPDTPADGDGVTTSDKPDVPAGGEGATTPDKPDVPAGGDGVMTPDKPDVPAGGDGATTPDKPDVPAGGDGATTPDKPDVPAGGDNVTTPVKPDVPADGIGDGITKPEDKKEEVTLSGNGDDLDKPEDDTDVEVTDEVFFNTGNHDWRIVNEEAFEGGIGDGCFEEDGSYTIFISEPNPFFPYEVQFTYEDKVRNCWFMDPDDSVSVGGHTFYVSAEYGDSALAGMKLNVGGDEIVVYPEKKTFTDDGEGISTYSLQPLEEKRLSEIDLSAYTPAELTMVSVDYLFKNGETDSAQNVVWKQAYQSADNYTVSAKGDKLDLSWNTNSSSPRWEMIVGSSDQLDTGNIRYFVPLRITASTGWLSPAVYKKDQDGNRSELTVRESYYSDTDSDREERRLSTYLGSSQIAYGEHAYITLGVNSSVFPSTQYSTLKVFEGRFTSAAEAQAQRDITEEICRSGYEMQLYGKQWVTMVTYDGGSVTGCLPVELEMWSENDGNYISEGLYEKKGTSRDYVYDTYSTSETDGCRNVTFTLYAEYPADNNYFLSLTYYQGGNSNSSAVTAAYAGQYASIAQAAAAGAADIKSDLFGAGYAADFSKGVNITVFVGGDGEGQEVYHSCYKAIAGTRPKKVSSGATRVWFHGLKNAEGNVVKSYVTTSGNYEDDSYGDNNFCTILVENTADLTKLAPEFSTADGINLYAEGDVLQVSGESMHDFSQGAIQYTASAENKEDSQNYWLQVVPVNSSRRLYINSLDDEAAETREENGVIYSKREVLLDEYHNYRHDILLINTGTQDIDKLGVELVSNTVALDEYWTLGGSNKLSAVIGVDRSTSNGELSNMAKIRLKRKDGIEDGADVEGTLTIKSGNDVLMVLTLTGTVGNPRIITDTIPQAVKYVPYGVMIQNNNKYSRNKTSYQLVRGSLPGGMELKSNGELYGVPTETGEFTFTVRLCNSLSSFGDSQKEYTLTVLDNTNANVDAATDSGYDLTQRVTGANLSVGESQTLVSEGEYVQFKYVFLDGVMLTEGTDYTSEAGSTRITIRNQTLALSRGTHTIGIEFRTQDENNTLNRAAQNYVIGGGSSGGDHGNSGSGSGSDSGSGSGSDNGSGGSDGGANAGSGSTGGSASQNVGQGNAGQFGGSSAAGVAGQAGAAGAVLGTPVSYTVQSGDTLWKIAEKQYGNGALWQKIYADNAGTISDPNRIYAGQIINIYPVQGGATAGIASAVSAIREMSPAMRLLDAVGEGGRSGRTYTVEAGDNLWKIARKVYGRGWQWRKIHRANEDQIPTPSSLRIGQVLTIPE